MPNCRQGLHQLKDLMKTWKTLLWVIFIFFFWIKMLEIIWPYTSGRLDIDFLLTKTAIVHLSHYQVAFYSHISSSLLVLLSGAFLFSKPILRRWPKIHRWAGKLYVALLIFISAPSGMLMALYANGGWLVKASFLILTPLWWWFTWKGFQTARRKAFGAHQVWMIRSYALTLSAVSLRVYQMILGHWFYIDPVIQYLFVSWFSWLGNLALAEIIIYFKFKQKITLSLKGILKIVNPQNT